MDEMFNTYLIRLVINKECFLEYFFMVNEIFFNKYVHTCNI